MRKLIKNILQKLRVYEYLKYSRIFSVYEKIFKPESKRTHEKEIKLYHSFLPSCNLIFDIGANDGHKAAAFLAISKKVICCEPDAQSFNKLQIRFRNKKSRVTLLNKALSNHEGQAVLYVHHAGSAFNTLNKKWVDILEKDNQSVWSEKIRFNATTLVHLTTLDALIEKYGNPGFIKIDVEGNELQVLKGLSRKVPWLSFECLLPDFMPELIESIEHLNKLDNLATYNIIQNEEILFSDFFTLNELYDWLKKRNPHYFEILVRMNAEN
jgi:FkbM family methyltransferase